MSNNPKYPKREAEAELENDLMREMQDLRTLLRRGVKIMCDAGRKGCPVCGYWSSHEPGCKLAAWLDDAGAAIK